MLVHRSFPFAHAKIPCLENFGADHLLAPASFAAVVLSTVTQIRTLSPDRHRSPHLSHAMSKYALPAPLSGASYHIARIIEFVPAEAARHSLSFQQSEEGNGGVSSRNKQRHVRLGFYYRQTEVSLVLCGENEYYRLRDRAAY